MIKRANGLLLHITSLPSKFGIGDLGPQAYRFIDFLSRSRQSYWQLLPLNPPTRKSNNSPYNCVSAFAGNPLLISPGLLYQQGLLSKEDISEVPAFPDSKVDYKKVKAYKTRLFSIAFEKFKKQSAKSDYEKFCLQNKYWLDDYACFEVLSNHFYPLLWCDWPKKFRDNNKKAVKSVKEDIRNRIGKQKFLQFIFSRQWFALKRYCNKKGIRIIGDVPIYVAYNSADAWSNPQNFKLAKSKKPAAVSGVPPDLFSKTGQLWNNPLYDWNTLKRNGYKWWLNRIKHNLNLFDLVRIDHFRGLVKYWRIPADAKNAVNGKWIDGPKDDFLKTLLKHIPHPSIIVEDLGYITPDVREFVRKYKFPGMRVVLFAFGNQFPKSPHCPGNYIKNCIAYTGTHDNNTAKGWFTKEANLKTKTNLFNYLGRKVPPSRIHRELIRLAMSSAANLVIIPVQDILGLDHSARMNHPARKKGNWRWRLKSAQLTKKLSGKILTLTKTYDRI